jgi:hypothetical protein
MTDFLSLYLALGRFLFRKPFAANEQGRPEPWKPQKDVAYFAVRLDTLDLSEPYFSSTFSEYGAMTYQAGKSSHIFASAEHAKEAAARVRKVLQAYHEELGY